MREGTRTFHYAIEKIKKEGGNEIFCYTIPPGFESHAELLAYWRELGYEAEIIDCENSRYGVLHISWQTIL